MSLCKISARFLLVQKWFPTSKIFTIFLISTLLAGALSASAHAAATPQAGGGLSRLRVSADGHFLEKSDGSPFFWLGDTAWFLTKLGTSDIDQYLADTAQKGFNGVLVDVGYYYFDPHGDPPFDNDDADTPSETYWRKVDWMVSQANAYRIYTALVVMWGQDYNLAFGNGNDNAKARRFGKWLGQRYGNRENVLWVISGEYGEIGSDKGKLKIFDNMAQGIREGGGRQLMTIHPNLGSSSNDFHASSWLDFNLLQSGYKKGAGSLGIENYQFIDKDYRLSPTKPTMEGEPGYEAVPENWEVDPNGIGPRLGADVVRRKAYWGVFAGGFGHTYGHKSIENLFVPGVPSSYPIGYSIPSWKEALNATGRTQMRYLRALVESKPILGRVPDQSILASNAGIQDTDHVQATRAADRSYAWIYIPNGGAVSINMNTLAGAMVNASWFNPRDGGYASVGQFLKSGVQSFDAPGPIASGNDWVLVLESTGTTPEAPLAVAGVSAANVTSSSATINWSTNKPADSQVEYIFPCPAAGCLTGLVSSLVTSHSINLANLAASTSYTYRVRSKDAGGNLVISANETFTTSAVTTQPPPTTTTSAVTGHWKLDEGLGTSALDSSGKGLNGSLINGPVWTSGRAGSALVFDGVNDYVELGNPTALQLTGPMTLSAWVNPKSTTYSGRIISKGSGPGLRGWSLNVETYNVFEFSVAASITDATTWVDSTTQVPLNTWTHVVGVYEPGVALRIYVNGVLSNTRSSGVPQAQFNAPVNARIGSRNDGFYFDGTIDDVRVYDKALTAAEIQQLYSDPTQSAPEPAGAGAPAPAAPAPAAGAAAGAAAAPATPPQITRPAPPDDLVAVCNGATAVTLNWSAVPTATSYYLRVSDALNSPTTTPDHYLDGIPSNTMTVNVKPGHEYKWWVHAANSIGLSPSRRGSFTCP